MNRDDIIRMAREAGGYPAAATDRALLLFSESHLERFAALVAAHTLSNIDPSKFMSYQEAYEAGQFAEREACAKVCEDEIARVKPLYSVVAENCVKAIRARK